MWVLLAAVIGGVLTLVTAVSGRLLDTWFEGAGARKRRALVANLDLFKALPDDLQKATGGQELLGRIDRDLVAFSKDPEPVEIDVVERLLTRVGIGGFVVTALAVGVVVWTELANAGRLTVASALLAGLGVLLGLLAVLWVARGIADVVWWVFGWLAKRAAAGGPV